MTDSKEKTVVRIVALMIALGGLVYGGGAVLGRSKLAAGKLSPLVLPRPSIYLRFSHRSHLSRKRMKCRACHQSALSSKRSSDRLIPPKKSCLRCHPDAKVPKGFGRKGNRDTETCRKCHTKFYPNGFPVPSQIPKPKITFSHLLHRRKGETCLSCHAGAAKSTRAASRHLPSMSKCRGCHRRRKASIHCLTCHEKRSAKRLRTKFKQGKLTPSSTLGLLNHTPTFRNSHAAAARSHRKRCRACHSDGSCLRCHGGRRKVLSVHPGNYRLKHGSIARRRPQRCKACHTRQRFCLGCHQRAGVSPTSKKPGYGPQGKKKYHPAGWASTASRSRARNRHAIHAKRGIGACVGCHRESTCIRCHATSRVGGYGRNPHGRGFAGSTRCRRASKRNKRACLKCHPASSRRLRCFK